MERRIQDSAKYKVELFAIKVNGWKYLTILTLDLRSPRPASAERPEEEASLLGKK